VLPRFFAMLLDSLLLGIVGFGVNMLAFNNAGLMDETTMMLVYGGYGLLSTLYIIILEAGGGTPGKRILGMRIVSAKDGGAPGFGRALVRNLFRFIDVLPFFYILGAILVATSDTKQRLGDRIAGTYVVKA